MSILLKDKKLRYRWQRARCLPKHICISNLKRVPLSSPY